MKGVLSIDGSNKDLDGQDVFHGKERKDDAVLNNRSKRKTRRVRELWRDGKRVLAGVQRQEGTTEKRALPTDTLDSAMSRRTSRRVTTFVVAWVVKILLPPAHQL